MHHVFLNRCDQRDVTTVITYFSFSLMSTCEPQLAIFTVKHANMLI